MAEEFDPSVQGDYSMQGDQSSPVADGIVSTRASRRGLLKMMAVGGAGMAAASFLRPGVAGAAATRVVATTTGTRKVGGRVVPAVHVRSHVPAGGGAGADDDAIGIGDGNFGSPNGNPTDLILDVDAANAGFGGTPQSPVPGLFVENDTQGAVAIIGVADGSNVNLGPARGRSGVSGTTYLGGPGGQAVVGDPIVNTGVTGAGGFDSAHGVSEVGVGVAGSVASDGGTSFIGPTPSPVYTQPDATNSAPATPGLGAGVTGSAGDFSSAAGVPFAFTGTVGVGGQAIQVTASAALPLPPTAVGLFGIGGGIGTDGTVVGNIPGSIGVLGFDSAINNGRGGSFLSLSVAGIGVSAAGETGVVGETILGNTANGNVNVSAGVVGIADPAPLAIPAVKSATFHGKAVRQLTLRPGHRAKTLADARHIKAARTATVKAGSVSTSLKTFGTSIKNAKGRARYNALRALKVTPAQVTPVALLPPAPPFGAVGTTAFANSAGVAGIGADAGGTSFGVFGVAALAGGLFIGDGVGAAAQANAVAGSGGIALQGQADVAVVAAGTTIGVSATGAVTAVEAIADVGGGANTGVIASGDTTLGSGSVGVVATGDALAVFAFSTGPLSTAVLAIGESFGVDATSDIGGVGVRGSSAGPGGAGVVGSGLGNDGVQGTSDVAIGVVGLSGTAIETPPAPGQVGIYGANTGTGNWAVIADGQNDTIGGTGQACGLLVINGAELNAAPAGPGGISPCPNVLNGPNFINGPTTFTGPVTGLFTSGTAFFAAGQQCVQVSAPSVAGTNTVYVQLLQPPNGSGPSALQLNAVEYISIVAGTGFTVCLARPTSQTTQFRWVIFPT